MPLRAPKPIAVDKVDRCLERVAKENEAALQEDKEQLRRIAEELFELSPGWEGLPVDDVAIEVIRLVKHLHSEAVEKTAFERVAVEEFDALKAEKERIEAREKALATIVDECRKKIAGYVKEVLDPSSLGDHPSLPDLANYLDEKAYLHRRERFGVVEHEPDIPKGRFVVGHMHMTNEKQFAAKAIYTRPSYINEPECVDLPCKGPGKIGPFEVTNHGIRIEELDVDGRPVAMIVDRAAVDDLKEKLEAAQAIGKRLTNGVKGFAERLEEMGKTPEEK